MERFRPRIASCWMALLVLLLLLQHLELGSSLNHEGRVLFRFREGVDPYASPSKTIPKNDEGDLRSSAGVKCKGGRVVSMNGGDATLRRLMQGRHGELNYTALPPMMRNRKVPPFRLPPPPPSPPPPSPPSLSLPPPPAHVVPSPSSLVNNAAPTHPSTTSHHRKIVVYSLIGAAGGLLLIAAIFVVFCRASKVVVVKPWVTGLSGQLQKAFVTGVPALKRSELEAACEDFSNIIGSISDGTLYKGTLSSGVEIAVSFIRPDKHWNKRSETQFREKIETLSKVNHKNFVNLIGYCEEEKPFSRMLVFEYAPNGTLYEHLHNKEVEGLNWAARLRIATGVAYCLDHMHQQNPPVVLRNLDSNSILLTDDFAAKIADLELWSETTASETPHGTSGPLDYQMPDQESVVHKFGILLLELITGRAPYSEEYGGLVASDYLRGVKPMEEMLDPTLKSYQKNDITAICQVIQSCLNSKPTERPSMKDLASRLREISSVSPDGAAPKLSPLWWAELEIISSVAN